MYPFKIKIKDPELIKIYQRLKQNKVAHISNKNNSRKITWQLKPIRPDIFLGRDSRYEDTYLALKPGITLEMMPLNKEKTVFDLMFEKLF